ncbi:TIGR02450 family Trp-rich protein [Colwellia sp. E2M01]|uniref:TIGR02450 family Trp-rich protein n=1 Tax=Colwellia sp. E2M01 TaxID=2841561 RepID=UPI001C095094|nr:TIGR02450 family Trp-rich protein [Colwellia sp. E2M01]MBU2870392.1 TIGR02450 family Trp-rich protein [Colwellia sp. E2M01]
MNKINPKALLNSKWSKVEVTNKEKHFIVTKVIFNDEQQVTDCVIEAVMTKNEYSINWRDLKSTDLWVLGWK